MRVSLWVLAQLLSLRAARAVNFAFEEIQLGTSDVDDFEAVAFGKAFSQHGGTTDDEPECRAFPGNQDWPTEADWSRLNETLDGALLRPTPVASVCYPGTAYDADRCKYLLRAAGATRFYLDDPLTALTQWTEGNSCLASLNATGSCSQGGFPLYVVNATTVKHVQAAVNFARNKRIRLVIKNTGHDFGGRSTGAASLSIWIHNLKSFEFLPEYTKGNYSGMAARVAAGVESWEMFNHMADHNISTVAPGGSTVGMMGGWLGSGGHGNLASTFGMGSDQALSIEVVTADGRLVTADPYTNADLFWALRGGGGGTYGVMTSMVMKAYEAVNMTGSSVSFAFSDQPPPNVTAPTWSNGTNATSQYRPRPPSYVQDLETFWKSVSLYYRFGQKVVDAGGTVFGYIYNQGNNSFSFSSSQTFPRMSPVEAHSFMQPLYDNFLCLGINLTNPVARTSSRYASGKRTGGGDSPGQTRYRSRLFPRENWEDDELFEATMRAIRRSMEAAGPTYNFHGIMHAPTEKVAGWPGADSAVNPAWRNGVLHGSLMEKQPVGLTAEQARARDADVKGYLDLWRAVTPKSGAYMNEGDPGEPDWQRTFYGDLYPRLLRVKRKWDPWGLFWAPTTVGSEAWEVRTEDGYPGSQNGRLCRVQQPDYWE